MFEHYCLYVISSLNDTLSEKFTFYLLYIVVYIFNVTNVIGKLERVQNLFLILLLFHYLKKITES